MFGLSHREVISHLSILCLDINGIAPIKKGMMQNLMDIDRNIDDCNVIAFDQICTQNVWFQKLDESLDLCRREDYNPRINVDRVMKCPQFENLSFGLCNAHRQPVIYWQIYIFGVECNSSVIFNTLDSVERLYSTGAGELIFRAYRYRLLWALRASPAPVFVDFVGNSHR